MARIMLLQDRTEFSGKTIATAERQALNLGWIVLGLVGWALGLVVVLALMRVAGNQDRAARHAQKRIDPYCDVTITRAG